MLFYLFTYIWYCMCHIKKAKHWCCDVLLCFLSYVMCSLRQYCRGRTRSRVERRCPRAFCIMPSPAGRPHNTALQHLKAPSTRLSTLPPMSMAPCRHMAA